MRSPSCSMVLTGLLLLSIELLSPGCASDGGYYDSQVSVGVYGGYYGGYPGYYGGDVMVGAPVHPGARPPAARPPQVSQLPSRPLPAPAPRPTPAPRPMPRGGGGRR